LRLLAPVVNHLQYVGAPTILTTIIDNHWGILVLFAILAEIRQFGEEGQEKKEDSSQRARRAQRRAWRRKNCRERRGERVEENSEMERLIMLEGGVPPYSAYQGEIKDLADFVRWVRGWGVPKWYRSGVR
jgi:Ni/Co efflux regulator RcnB